jgi:DNA-directed RNA polymerase subunit M
MKFCENCGNVLVVITEDDGKFLFCRNCNIKSVLDTEVVFTTNFDEKHEIAVFDSNEDEFPITNVLCPKCEDMVEAEWAMQQTRAADEPPTRFYRCKRCKWVWREYA